MIINSLIFKEEATDIESIMEKDATRTLSYIDMCGILVIEIITVVSLPYSMKRWRISLLNAPQPF